MVFNRPPTQSLFKDKNCVLLEVLGLDVGSLIQD